MTLKPQLLTLVLDELIPPSPDGRLPGAGTLGVGNAVQTVLSAMPALEPVLAQGFATLEDIARHREEQGFVALPRGARIETLRELEKADALFLPTLLSLACVGYYSDERVLAVLNGNARPPHPEGYAVEPDDLSLLDGIRSRGRIYRDC
jgi:Gluconate 2-dehydrogenase subunit 3